MRRGEVFLAQFPFGDVAATKLRPVLLLTGPVGVGTEVLVGYISSVVPTRLLSTDILLDPMLPDHKATGLKMVSVLRLHKIATIHRTSLQRHLGQVSPTVEQQVDGVLRLMLRL